MNRRTNRRSLSLSAVLATVLAVVLVAGSAGCGSTPATITYQTIGGVKLAVDTAMGVWANRVVDGKTTPAQEKQVKTAFDQYTATARAAAAVMRATTDPAPPNLTNAANALLNLLNSFGAPVTPLATAGGR